MNYAFKPDIVLIQYMLGDARSLEERRTCVNDGIKDGFVVGLAVCCVCILIQDVIDIASGACIDVVG